MKITTHNLRSLIREELNKMIEAGDPRSPGLGLAGSVASLPGDVASDEGDSGPDSEWSWLTTGQLKERLKTLIRDILDEDIFEAHDLIEFVEERVGEWTRGL